LNKYIKCNAKRLAVRYDHLGVKWLTETMQIRYQMIHDRTLNS